MGLAVARPLRAIVASRIPDLAVSPCNSVQAVFSPFGQRYSLLAAAHSAAGVSVPNPPTLLEYGINSGMPMRTQIMVARVVLPPGRPGSVGAGTLTPLELPPRV